MSVSSPATRANGPIRSVTILGATGSVGTSTLDLIGQTPDAFEIVALTAQCNAKGLAELAIRHRAQLAVIGDDAHYAELQALLSGTGIACASGGAAIEEAASRPADCVMASIVGAAGLRPTFAAARQGRRVALANKECLVSAGDVFLSEVAQSGAELLPVDSEHSGVMQAIAGAHPSGIETITLTASGGPFRSWSAQQISACTLEDALRHPSWTMGRKITIDSATLMNKGLELIEAFHLFPVEAHQLAVVVHPQSIIHALVSYTDGSVIAQLAAPDMRTPIALSLSWPRRMSAPTARLDLIKLGTLTFEAPDEIRFPCLRLAREALACGRTAPAVLNAANEIAVAAFLERKIGFTDIANIVEKSLDMADATGCIIPATSLDDVLAADAEGRQLARSVLSAS
ncbi:MAG: 1-deoxy-D-xylulose-5-phosphate reductoisomerase [Hyphomicrobiaceae bacterium]